MKFACARVAIVLLAFAVFRDTASTSHAEEAPTADGNTVLLLHFDEEGDEVTDASTRNVRVRMRGGWRVEGRFGRALFFDGTGGFIEIPGSVLPPDGDFTFEAWIKVRKIPLILFADAYRGVRLVDGGKGIRFSIGDGNKVLWKDSSAEYIDDAWHKVALVIRAREHAALYIDRKLMTEFDLGELKFPIQFPEFIFVGGWPRYPGRKGDWMTGAIDEVRISHVARSLDEIFGAQDP